MKITLKTMQNQQYPLIVEQTDTILEVKKKIEAQEKHEVASQKLIFTGKVLEDNKTLEEYNIKENDFLVLLVRKPTGKPSQTAATSSTPSTTPSTLPTTSTSTTTTTTTSTPTTTPTTPQPTTPTPAPSATPAVTNTTAPTAQTPSSETQRSALTTAAETLVVPGSAEYEAIISRLLELGYERERIVEAMKASFNNPDRAVEYLMSEIPASHDPPPSQPRVPNSPPTASPSSPTPPAPLAPSSGAPSGVFDALRNNPQFMTIRGMIQNNPQLLQPILQTLGSANPELLQQISQNQEDFIRLLNEPVPRAPGGAPGGSFAPSGAEGSGGAPGPHYIQVTPEEKEAIDRLEGLGFERAAAIQAYFACDKDETLAANYLIENRLEDEMEGTD